MTFTQVFGGTTIYPSDVSYRAISLSANQTLSWPMETATNGDVVAQIMDVTPSAGSLSISMPPANETSVGETALFFNAGSYSFTVKNNTGGTIVSVAPGLSYQVYLTDNSTAAGTWRSTQFAAGVSSATAGALVGAGIKAINTTLNQSMYVSTLNSDYVIGDADRSIAFVWTGGAGALTLPASGTVGNDWFCQIRNSGTGSISVSTVGSDLINGGASLTFSPGDSAVIICDGTDFFTIGFGQSASFSFDYVSIDLTGEPSPYTLSGANLNRVSYRFAGTLTANMTVHIPATVQQYWIANDTTGAFTLTVKVAGQTGVAIPQGSRAICYCDGTDLLDADTASFAFPVSIVQGGTGATSASAARVNLGGTSTGIAVYTAASATDGRTALSAAQLGANSDITSLSGLTTPLSVPQGGTGAASFTSGYVLKGAGAASVSVSVIYDSGSGVGIGTASPASYATRLALVGADGAVVSYVGTTTQGIYISVDNATKMVYLSSSGSAQGGFILRNGNTDAVKIETSGAVAIGAASAGAGTILDVQSTTAGVRFPNMTSAQKSLIAPVAGTVVFDTTLSKLCVYTGAAWQTITSV